MLHNRPTHGTPPVRFVHTRFRLRCWISDTHSAYSARRYPVTLMMCTAPPCRSFNATNSWPPHGLHTRDVILEPPRQG